MSIVSKERVEITPQNQPSDNSYSFKGGFPIIQFQIPSESKFLDSSSVRINGTLRVCQPTSTNETPVLVNNAANKGGTQFDCCLSSRVGVASCVDQIILSSMQNQSLEVVRSYGRYLASAQSVTHSQEDFDTNLQLSSLTSSRQMNGALMVNQDVSFCIPLRTGLLSGTQAIPIGNNGIRGMQMEIQLAPDSHVLSGYTDNAGDSKNDAGTGTGSFYQLRDVTLSYDLLVPDADTMDKMSIPSTGALEYNSVSQLYSIINSSDQTQTYNLGTSKTLSVFNNFIPTTHINSYDHDGFSTGGLKIVDSGQYGVVAPITRVSFLKGGQLFPIDNQIDVEQSTLLRNDARPQSELDQQFIGSIKPLHLQNHSLMSLNTNSGISTAVSSLTGQDLTLDSGQQFQLPDQEPVFGVGCSMDVYKGGVDYSSETYGVRIVSLLDGKSPNSMYSYILSKNVLQYSPQGISVMN